MLKTQGEYFYGQISACKQSLRKISPVGGDLPEIKERKNAHENNQRRHSQYRNHCPC